MIYIQLQDQLQSITINNIQLQDWYNDLQSIPRPITRPITINYKTDTMIYNQFQDQLHSITFNYKTNTMIYNQLED